MSNHFFDLNDSAQSTQYNNTDASGIDDDDGNDEKGDD